MVPGCTANYADEMCQGRSQGSQYPFYALQHVIVFFSLPFIRHTVQSNQLGLKTASDHRLTIVMGFQVDIAPYHDDAEEAEAVSMHTTRGDYAYDDVPELPSYSDSEAAASASRDAINATSSTDYQMLWCDDPYATAQPLRNTHYRSNGRVQNYHETTIRMASSPGYNRYMKHALSCLT